MATMSVVRWVVVDSIRPDGTAASAIQWSIWRVVGGARGLLRQRLDRIARHGQRAAGDEQDEEGVDRRSTASSAVEAHQRLDDQRVGDQPGEAAEIRGGIERIGIAAARLQRVPALHQRRLGRDDEEQRPDRADQEPGHPEGGLRRRPAGLRRDSPIGSQSAASPSRTIWIPTCLRGRSWESHGHRRSRRAAAPGRPASRCSTPPARRRAAAAPCARSSAG